MVLGRYRIALSLCRATLGTVALAAIGAQLAAASHHPNFQFAYFFGYFTILSNTGVALLLVYIAATTARTVIPSHRLDIVRGAATLCLALVGLIFWGLLAHLESDILPWVNLILHYLLPIATIADWIIDPPRARISRSETISWLALPLAYIAYTLVHGAIVHWYPYPFLNVDTLGWTGVAPYIAGITVFTLVLAAILAAIGNALQARDAARTA